MLMLEQLEDRLCLNAAPTLSFMVQEEPLGKVRIIGDVIDESPSTVLIYFFGAANATHAPDAQGHFDFVTDANYLGTIDAIAYDDQNNTSEQISAELISEAPLVVIDQVIWGMQEVTIKGYITDEFVESELVEIYGVTTGWGLTDAQGNFTITVPVTSLGEIAVVVADHWGQGGTAQYTLTNTKPIVTDLTITEAPGGFLTFSGKVTDEYSDGTLITCAGLPSIQGKILNVRSDGTWSITITKTAADTGEAVFYATDQWGVNSDTVSIIVT